MNSFFEKYPCTAIFLWLALGASLDPIEIHRNPLKSIEIHQIHQIHQPFCSAFQRALESIEIHRNPSKSIEPILQCFATIDPMTESKPKSVEMSENKNKNRNKNRKHSKKDSETEVKNANESNENITAEYFQAPLDFNDNWDIYKAAENGDIV